LTPSLGTSIWRESGPKNGKKDNNNKKVITENLIKYLLNHLKITILNSLNELMKRNISKKINKKSGIVLHFYKSL